MTYNFDPERWYNNEHAFLKQRYHAGEISEPEYAAALKALGKRLDEMWERVDGTYKISKKEPFPWKMNRSEP